MSQTLRHPQILEIARAQGRVTVEGLSDQLGVSVQTIRRDLSDLSETGRLERVHGGAVLPSGVRNIGYADRQVLNAAAKDAMARAVAAHIPNGASLFLNIGTSTEAVSRALEDHRDLLVVTNNLNVARNLAAHDSCETILTGGALRRADGGLTGPLTLTTIRQFKCDFAVIGCSALDGDGDLLDFDPDEVAASQAILDQARHRILVADHTKFQRRAPARIISMQALDRVVTDAPLPGDLLQRCADWGTRVEVSGL